jgi:hypothetical protein
VDLNALPEPPAPLKNTEFGILDLPTCRGEPTSDFTVRLEQDPRFASEEQGRKNFDTEVYNLARIALDALRQLN